MQLSTSYDLLILLGPTATGKTRLAVELARRMQGEIISADSRQVYKGMDIGTGKDLSEYAEIPYHLIDIVDPGQEFSLFNFLQHFIDCHRKIRRVGKCPILAGGTGMYLDAVIRGYKLVEAPENPTLRRSLESLNDYELKERLLSLKPELHNTTDTEERQRTVRAIEIAQAEKQGDAAIVQVKCSPLILGINIQADILRKRIEERLEKRFQEGMIDEVEMLRKNGLSWKKLDYFGLEYRYIALYLQGELNRNDMQQKLASAIYQFARQQLKWFRRMQRQGVDIHWLDIDKPLVSQALDVIDKV